MATYMPPVTEKLQFTACDREIINIELEELHHLKSRDHMFCFICLTQKIRTASKNCLRMRTRD